MKIIAYNAVYSQNCKRFFVAFLQKVISDENTPNSKYCFFVSVLRLYFAKNFFLLSMVKRGTLIKLNLG